MKKLTLLITVFLIFFAVPGLAQQPAPVKVGHGLFYDAISQSGGSLGPPRSTTYQGENLKRLTDAAFGWHTWIWVQLQAQTGKSKVFYYYFDQTPHMGPVPSAESLKVLDAYFAWRRTP